MIMILNESQIRIPDSGSDSGSGFSSAPPAGGSYWCRDPAPRRRAPDALPPRGAVCPARIVRSVILTWPPPPLPRLPRKQRMLDEIARAAKGRNFLSLWLSLGGAAMIEAHSPPTRDESVMGDRLTVRRQTLPLVIGVRIPVPQPTSSVNFTSHFHRPIIGLFFMPAPMLTGC